MNACNARAPRVHGRQQRVGPSRLAAAAAPYRALVVLYHVRYANNRYFLLSACEAGHMRGIACRSALRGTTARRKNFKWKEGMIWVLFAIIPFLTRKQAVQTMHASLNVKKNHDAQTQSPRKERQGH